MYAIVTDIHTDPKRYVYYPQWVDGGGNIRGVVKLYEKASTAKGVLTKSKVWDKPWYGAARVVRVTGFVTEEL